MKATDLALGQLLGIRLAPAGAGHLLEMPFTDALRNHVGTVHAAAQFALAEAASAECLQRYFGAAAGPVLAVVRGVEVKYRRPATAELLAHGRPDEATLANLLPTLAARGRSQAVILIDLKDRAGTITFHGKFEWFISTAPTLQPSAGERHDPPAGCDPRPLSDDQQCRRGDAELSARGPGSLQS